MRPLRIGSRGSALALWQANHVRDQLAKIAGAEPEIVIIKTSGDNFQQVAIAQIGVKGVFIKELEEALLDQRVDLAVHSMKDVPTEVPAGLGFAAICRREDPRDCVLSRSGKPLADLPAGARVGTSSVRRQAQLRRFRPELTFCELRGNVDTRIRKLEQGDYDAIVLAKAGMDRLGLTGKIAEVISTEVCLPAAGQGALGIETRADDAAVVAAVAQLDHAETRAAVTAERALLAELEGGCQLPLGAWARIEQGRLVLDGCVISPDGTDYVRRGCSDSAKRPEQAGRELARLLLEAGAARILKLAGRAVGSR